MEDLISIIIPTRDRPTLLLRAVASCLSQTHTNLELIVVIDGPNPATQAAIGRVQDKRLRVVQAPTRLGGAGARNFGICEAKAEWIAFLDDDDEWLPQKANLQLCEAKRLSSQSPLLVVGCSYLLMHGDSTIEKLPRRKPVPNETISEYLFCANSFSAPANGLISSTLLMSRALAEAVKFSPGLPRHQDGDWILKAKAAGALLSILDESLVLYHADHDRERITTTATWKDSYNWASSNPSFTKRSYASFLVRDCLYTAAKAGLKWQTFPEIPFKVIRNDAKDFRMLLVMSGLYLLPLSLLPAVHLVFTKLTHSVRSRPHGDSTSPQNERNCSSR